jgi:single-strand DNA-binding protein
VDNFVAITGNVSQEIRLNRTGNGTSVANTSVAVSRKKGEEKVTSYFDVTIWGRLAENVARSIQKGERVTVTGTINQEKFEKDGQKRSTIVIYADTFGKDERFTDSTPTAVTPGFEPF